MPLLQGLKHLLEPFEWALTWHRERTSPYWDTSYRWAWGSTRSWLRTPECPSVCLSVGFSSCWRLPWRTCRAWIKASLTWIKYDWINKTYWVYIMHCILINRWGGFCRTFRKEVIQSQSAIANANTNRTTNTNTNTRIRAKSLPHLMKWLVKSLLLLYSICLSSLSVSILTFPLWKLMFYFSCSSVFDVSW